MAKLAEIVITGVVTFIFGKMQERYQAKPKIVYWMPGTFIFTLPAQNNTPSFQVRTDALTVQNIGKKSATDIEIIHKSRPDHFEFSTAVNWSESTNPSGNHIIHIANIAPGEHINLQILSTSTYPFFLQIRCNECKVDAVQVSLLKIDHKIIRIGRVLLSWIGVGTVIYLIAKLGMAVIPDSILQQMKLD